ncbi:MAG: hypothetical protein K9J25_13715 [Bacteroidales bacterium]|nr:hypothetical protein [Bacteroidales bacterium]
MTDKPESRPERSGSDEIDLLELFRNFGNFIARIFRGFFNGILQFIIFSIRKWLYLLVAVIVALAFSYFYPNVKQDFYYSDLVLKSNAVENQEMISYINRLGNLTSEGNYPVLASSLNIDSADAEKIGNIRAYWFVDKNKDGIVDEADIDNKFLADTSVSKVNRKFGVRATVTEPHIYDKLSSGIEYYVNSNDYFNKMNESRLDNLREIIEQTDSEVEKLDSLQKKEYFKLEDVTRFREGQLVFTNDPEIKLLHDDLLGLVRNRQASRRELSIHDSIISILEDFTVTRQPVNTAVYYAKTALPVLIVLAYLLALYITFRKKIHEAIRK